MATCPICNAEVSPESTRRPVAIDAETTLVRAPIEPGKSGKARPVFPFCSERCRTIDLGKWLTGDYRVPVTEEEDEDGEGEVPSPEDS